MRKTYSLLFYLLAVSFALGLAACGDDKDNNVNSLRLAEELKVFGEKGGDQKFTVQTDAPSWNADLSDKSWFSIEKGENEFTISAPLNDKEQERTTTLTVTAGNAEPISLTVKQEAGGKAYFNYSEEDASQEFEFKNNTPVTIPISTNRALDIQKGADSEWILYSTNEQGVVIDVEGNPGDPRQGTLIVNCSGFAPFVITVDQKSWTFTDPLALEGEYNVSGDPMWSSAPGVKEWISELYLSDEEDYYIVTNFGNAGFPSYINIFDEEPIFGLDLVYGNLSEDLWDINDGFPLEICLRAGFVTQVDDTDDDGNPVVRNKINLLRAPWGYFDELYYNPVEESFTPLKYTYKPDGSEVEYPLYYGLLITDYLTEVGITPLTDFYDNLKWVRKNAGESYNTNAVLPYKQNLARYKTGAPALTSNGVERPVKNIYEIQVIECMESELFIR